MLHAEILFSKAKWKKGLLFLTELWKIAVFQIARGLRGGRAPTSNIVRVTASDPLKTIIVRSSYSLESSIPVPPELYERCNDYIQDRYNEETGCVETHFDYEVVIVNQGVLYSNGCTHVSVYDQHGEFREGLSYKKYAKKSRTNLSIKVDRYVEGKTASLYGNVENTVGNYGHWLIDGIARYFQIMKEFSPSEIDHYLVPKLTYDFQLDSLVKLGIDPAKLIEIESLECIRFEQLVCSTAPRGYSSCICPGWLIDGFRGKYLPELPPTVPNRRLYISRRDAGSRKFSNETDVARLFENYGFEVVELAVHSLSSKIELFYSAECIVGLTGAGMTNFMFCQKVLSASGSDRQTDNTCRGRPRIIELIPDTYVNYLYAAVCGYLNLDYRYVIFRNDSRLSKSNRYYGNLTMDIGLLESELISLGYKSGVGSD